MPRNNNGRPRPSEKSARHMKKFVTGNSLFVALVELHHQLDVLTCENDIAQIKRETTAQSGADEELHHFSHQQYGEWGTKSDFNSSILSPGTTGLSERQGRLLEAKQRYLRRQIELALAKLELERLEKALQQEINECHWQELAELRT